MLGNTTGSAQHKVKTINVEVNLLDAWAEQRVELEASVFKKVFALVAITMIGFVAVPILVMQRASVADQSRQIGQKLEASLKTKTELAKQAKMVAPSIQMDDMIARCHQYSNSYLNELTKVINAAPTLMYFEQFQTEVTGGECTITGCVEPGADVLRHPHGQGAGIAHHDAMGGEDEFAARGRGRGRDALAQHIANVGSHRGDVRRKCGGEHVAQRGDRRRHRDRRGTSRIMLSCMRIHERRSWNGQFTHTQAWALPCIADIRKYTTATGELPGAHAFIAGYW